MILEALTAPRDHALPGPLLAEVTALYAANREFQALSGDFPDPDAIRPEQVAAALAQELAHPDTEVLLARSRGRLIGMVITLARHPDPADPDPWIGLLLVDPAVHRQGYGRRLATAVEDRFRAAGRGAVRLAVLDNNPRALAFWTSCGYEIVGHRRDRALNRPCAVLSKSLRAPRRAARVAVVDPEGAVLLFRYDDVEAGAHWALPGGGLEPGETPSEGALRALREETGWTDLEPGPPLCTWEHDFTHSGIPVRQHEHVHVTRGPRRDPAGPRLAAAHAADGIPTWRWWTRPELAEEAEPVRPPRLARLLDEWEA